MDGNELGAVIAIAAYNLALLVGCAFLVGWHGWSPWWFALAASCMKSIRMGKAAEIDA